MKSFPVEPNWKNYNEFQPFETLASLGIMSAPVKPLKYHGTKTRRGLRGPPLDQYTTVSRTVTMQVFLEAFIFVRNTPCPVALGKRLLLFSGLSIYE